MKNIKVLGNGCAKYNKLAKLVTEVVYENNLKVTIEKIEDYIMIMEYNIMTIPALAIDNVITTKKEIPSKEEILKMLITKQYQY
ncbi:thioredoxin family protein [Polaribacter sargassicola]|uniref:thioredoxin family protein n=1 Tax=Polaribacter sargassicola TaxID=2836891 RepID=UPI001F45EC21|nr:thioredoxin family protein [Polaribacter sp. DS7-9]MCG1036769.1 thioredoxin family protein [Polaribacter sp. DS7-9]